MFRFHFSLLSATLLFFTACEKLEFTPDPFLGETSVTVNELTGEVLASSALQDFDVLLASDELTIIQHGHLWGTQAGLEFPAEEDPRNPFNDRSQLGPISTADAIETFFFQSRVQRLIGSTNYYVRPYVTFSNGEHQYGPEELFTSNFNSFLDMVFVEGGRKFLGDSLGIGANDERPASLITVDDFAISRYEVSRAFFDAVMNTNYAQVCPLCPVNQISWIEAKLFINALNERFKNEREFDLPTEAQWEFAARGGKKESNHYTYSGSENLEEVAWHLGNSATPGKGALREIGLLAPNALGIYDMSGNVIEWCEDWYSNDYYKKRPNVNPLNQEINFDSTYQNFKEVIGGTFLLYFNPEITEDFLTEELSLSAQEVERYFYTSGIFRFFVEDTWIEFYPKVARSCSFMEPNDFNQFCRISNRVPGFAIHEKDERVGFRIIEKL